MIMKKNCILGVAALLGVALLAGCKKDEKPVVFPELKEHDVVVGQTGTFEFEASHDWTLSALDGNQWVRFVTPENTAGDTQISGPAGAVSIDYIITKAGLRDFAPTVCELELVQQGLGKIIYRETRPARIQDDETAIVMYQRQLTGAQEPEPIDVVEFTFDTERNRSFSIQVGFVAKFDWEVVSIPEGVTFDGEPLTGTQYAHPAKASDYRSFYIEDDKVAYALPAGAKIVVQNRQDPSQKIEFPVTYAGIPDNNVVAISPIRLTNAGETFNKEGKLLNSGQPYEDQRTSATATVLAKEMIYTLHVVEYTKEGQVETARELTGDEKWVNFTDDSNGKIEFSVESNSGAERTAYILVLPESETAPALDNGAAVGAYIAKKWGIKVSQEKGEVNTGGAAGFFVAWGSSQTAPNVGANQDFYYKSAPTTNQAPANPDNVSEYRFTDADINGNLTVLPLAFQNQNWGFVKIVKYQTSTNWNGVTLEGGTAYPNGMMQSGVGGALKVKGINSTNGVMRAGLVLFFKEDYRKITEDYPTPPGFDDLTTKADAALLLIQNPQPQP